MVIHLFRENNLNYWSIKEEFTGKPLTYEGIPSVREILSATTTAVVFKIPNLLKERSLVKKFKLLMVIITTFLSRKYYSSAIPRALPKFLSQQKGKNLFFIGGSMGSDLIRFHYAHQEDVIIEGVETINLIAKDNKALGKNIDLASIGIEPIDIFIVGLFSTSLLKYLRSAFPNANISIRYFDLLRPNRLSEFREVVEYARIAGINLSIYERSIAEKAGIPYDINRVKTEKISLYRKKHKNYDVTFLGGYSLERERALRPILKALKKCEFKIKLLLVNAPCKEIEGIPIDTKALSYEEYLNVTAQGRALIDLWRLEPYEGYSFRISEALALDLKIITNRKGISNEAFFDETRFFVFDENKEVPTQDLIDFMLTQNRQIDKKFFAVEAKK